MTARHHRSSWPRMLACACAALLAGQSAEAVVIPIDPGPVGSLFPNKIIPFNDLNGVQVTGQTLDLEFTFPLGVGAVYRSLPGGRDLYGWSATLSFTGGNTVNVGPAPLSTAPRDEFGVPVGPGFPANSIGDGSAGFVRYFSNLNTQFSNASLIAFTDVPYHSVRFQFQLPTFAESNVTISSATFSFDNRTIFGTGDRTQIILIPEPTAALLATCGVLLSVRRRRGVVSA